MIGKDKTGREERAKILIFLRLLFQSQLQELKSSPFQEFPPG
jgi:hypothetical protein